MAVTITGGAAEHHDGRGWQVPKVDLMAGLQELLEREELVIARGLVEAGTLVKELMSVSGTVKGSGRLRVGADGEGEHDDLVMAVALACWAGRKGSVGDRGVRLFW